MSEALVVTEYAHLSQISHGPQTEGTAAYPDIHTTLIDKLPHIGSAQPSAAEIINRAVIERLGTIGDVRLYIRGFVGDQLDQMTDTEAAALVKADLAEQGHSLEGVLRAAQTKQALAQIALGIYKTEKEKPTYHRISEIGDISLDAAIAELDSLVDKYGRFANKTVNAGATTLNPSNLRQDKKEYIRLTTNLVAALTSLENVSSVTDVHGGPVRAFWHEIGDMLYDSASIYTREVAGSWGAMLAKNIGREYGLPPEGPSSKSNVEVFSSGMGALATIMTSVRHLGKCETHVTDGFYFEVPELAKREGMIGKVDKVDSGFYATIQASCVRKTTEPLVVFGQPFPSSPEMEVFDIDKILTSLEQNPVQRPIYIVMDSTMHGATVGGWERIEKLNESGKGVTLVHIQSLIKHGQLGTDKASAGVALAYGTNADIVKSSGGALGTIVNETNAAYLFPLDSAVQKQRIARAGRNAEFVYDFFAQKLKDCPYFEDIYIASHADSASAQTSKKYGISPPFIFMKVNPLVAEHVERITNRELNDRVNQQPLVSKGTSYGFDETRVEVIPIGGDRYIRIATGQESVLQAMQVANTLDEVIRGESVQRNVRELVRQEMDSIVEHIGYNVDEVEVGIYYDALFDDETNAATYLEQVTSPDAQLYLSSQYRGWRLVDGLSSNPRLREFLGITEADLARLQASLDEKGKINRIRNKYIVSSSAYVKQLQKKLTVFGKPLSRSQVHMIAKYVIGLNSVGLNYLPVAKDVYTTVHEVRPEEYEF